MAIRRDTIREELMYAVMVSEAIIEGEGRTKEQARKDYGGFVSTRYKALIEGRAKPATMLRQNPQLVDRPSGRCEYCGTVGRTQWDHIISK